MSDHLVSIQHSSLDHDHFIAAAALHHHTHKWPPSPQPFDFQSAKPFAPFISPLFPSNVLLLSLPSLTFSSSFPSIYPSPIFILPLSTLFPSPPSPLSSFPSPPFSLLLSLSSFPSPPFSLLLFLFSFPYSPFPLLLSLSSLSSLLMYLMYIYHVITSD